jgi:8-oxo-dGTP pyrophosphatase MutT (NUDIX family)
MIPAVYLILEENGKYLFLKRANSGYMDGFYQFPAGHVDGGEPLKKDMVREAKEEINLELLEQDLKLSFIGHRFIETGVERLDFFFSCTRFDKKSIKNMEPEKCSEIIWLDKNNSQIVPYIKEVIDKIDLGENYLDTGFVV